MELSWKELARLYAPFLCLSAINLLGAIYAYGYRDGQRRLMQAAASSAEEAKNG